MKLMSGHIGTCVRVRTSAGVGTCFFRRVGAIGRFLSAAHVFRGVQAGETIFFRRNEEWEPYVVREIASHPDGHDVCAFTLENLVWEAEDDPQTIVGLWPGEPVRFLGFPHGLENTYPSETGFPTPLVRNAHLSGVITHNGLQVTVLDGFNNPGYSGGPVYATGDEGVPVLVGLISGYRTELREKSMVYRILPDDGEEIVEGHFVKPNSGMIIAVSLSPVLETFGALTTTNAPG
jgi:hypothetical protein